MADIQAPSLEHELHKANRYFHRFVSYKHIFLRGMFGGLGWSIGATVVIAVLFWILSQLSSVPLVGSFINDTREIIQNNQPNLGK